VLSMTHCPRTASFANLRPISSGRIGTLALLLLLALAACGGDGGGVPPEGPTTVAYAVTQCAEGPAGAVAQQSLRIRHGDQEVTVAEFGPLHLPTFYGMCRDFGLVRFGSASVRVFPIQRVGVSRDGSTVVFEVTDDFSLLLPDQLVPPQQEGIYVVHADGSGLRRLGPASRDPIFGGSSGLIFPFFGFSPDGRTVVFTDLDPQVPDPDAPQIVALDLTSGVRTVLTQLPPVAQPPYTLRTIAPAFLDAQTVVFASYANPDDTNPENAFTAFTVRIDAKDKKVQPVPVTALPGGTLIPNFSITSAEPTARGLSVRGPSGDTVREIFLFDTNPSQVLQLTNFGRDDTVAGRLTADRQRVLFIASADPLGENPDNNCEFFSTDRTGADLRQLTHIGEGGQPRCDYFAPYIQGCSITLVRVDPLTGWVSFESNCDPFGTNPYGDQIFTMRPDGSGLRQLTTARGITTEADGTVSVELPGPWGSPTRDF
jgi:hypothetical protein